MRVSFPEASPPPSLTSSSSPPLARRHPRPAALSSSEDRRGQRLAAFREIVERVDEQRAVRSQGAHIRPGDRDGKQGFPTRREKFYFLLFTFYLRVYFLI